MAASGTRISSSRRLPSGLTKALILTSVGMSCAAALDRIRDRYCAISFDLEQDSDRMLSVDESKVTVFDPEDAPYLATAMMIFPDGRLVKAGLDTIYQIDQHIEAERLRLRARYPEKKIAWRAPMFTGLYCGQPGPHEFWVALQDARSSGLWRDAKETYDRTASLLAGYSSLTPGQLYFLIEGFHASYTREVPPPSFLYELAERAWTKVVEIEKGSEISGQAHFALAGLYRKQGKAEDAEREMGEYKKLQNTSTPPEDPQK